IHVAPCLQRFGLVGRATMHGMVLIRPIAGYAAQEGDILDRLAQPLQDEHDEGDDDDSLERIARQAAWIGTLLQLHPGTLDIAQAEIDRKDAEWDQKHERAENVDPGLG